MEKGTSRNSVGPNPPHNCVHPCRLIIFIKLDIILLLSIALSATMLACKLVRTNSSGLVTQTVTVLDTSPNVIILTLRKIKNWK